MSQGLLDGGRGYRAPKAVRCCLLAHFRQFLERGSGLGTAPNIHRPIKAQLIPPSLFVEAVHHK